MSQFVEKERILKLSESDRGGEWLVPSAGVDGVEEGPLAILRIGNSGCVQHRPWLTQPLQKPQSPSLH